MAKRENPRRKEREFNKFQEKQARAERRREYTENYSKRSNDIMAEEIREDLVLGRNAVIEALKSDTTIEYLCVSKGDLEGSIKVVLSLAKDKNVVIKAVDRRKLNEMCGGANHQGVIAKVTPFKYSEVTDIINRAKRRGEDPFIVILDEIEDPHNLGSIIRTAELCGVHGIIIPKRRAVGLTATVAKSSAGALEHMLVAKVTNLPTAIDDLKERGLWIYAADMDGTTYYKTDMKGATALVLGSEGFGISRLVKEKCDFIVSIPLYGQVNSMNVSCAAAVLLAEVARQRNDGEV
jgi:23S rRNA (guanosine2251-2'-O)-methyltransferase